MGLSSSFKAFGEGMEEMLENLLIGCGFAFAAAIQPGPLQAFLLSSVAQRGWKRTLPAALAPLLSDGPIALFVLLVLNRLPDAMGRILQAAGGVLLLYLAWAGYRQWRQKAPTDSEQKGPAPRTLFQAAGINLLNPNPYLGWSSGVGPGLSGCMASGSGERRRLDRCLLRNHGNHVGGYHPAFWYHEFSRAARQACSDPYIGHHTRGARRLSSADQPATGRV